MLTKHDEKQETAKFCCVNYLFKEKLSVLHAILILIFIHVVLNYFSEPCATKQKNFFARLVLVCCRTACSFHRQDRQHFLDFQLVKDLQDIEVFGGNQTIALQNFKVTIWLALKYF